MTQHEGLETSQLRKLRQEIVKAFSLGELETLCFDLGVNYDALPGVGLDAKARDLILFMQKRGELLALLDYCRKERSAFDWPEPSVSSRPAAPSYRIDVANEDITTFPCDVVALKYAQAFYRTDTLVAARLRKDYETAITPRPGDFRLLATSGKIAARYALFLGVEPLYRLDYAGIRQMAADVLGVLAVQLPATRHVGMTIHGTGFGLDETEAFLAQVGGFTDAFSARRVPAALERVTIVERDARRAERLARVLSEHLRQTATLRQDFSRAEVLSERMRRAGAESHAKPHIFVAIPSNAEMEDVFVWGIQEPVEAGGYLCEKLDLGTLDDDVLARARSRIETASLVIADLTGANPGAYLAVGYAWGRGRPTLLIARKGAEVKLDLPDQKCLVYVNVTDLHRKLEADLGKYVG